MKRVERADSAIADQDVGSRKPSEVRRLEIPVTGMTCAACAARVQKGLSRAPGVRDAAVNFATERATVEYDPSSATASLVEAVESSGYGARIEEVTLQVAGLEWAVSGEPVERELRALAGVLSAEVNIASGGAHVRYLPDVVTPSDLELAVRSSGYELAAPIDAADPAEREQAAGRRSTGSCGTSSRSPAWWR
jgi:P-type Cu+ transporter